MPQFEVVSMEEAPEKPVRPGAVITAEYASLITR